MALAGSSMSQNRPAKFTLNKSHTRNRQLSHLSYDAATENDNMQCGENYSIDVQTPVPGHLSHVPITFWCLPLKLMTTNSFQSANRACNIRKKNLVTCFRRLR